MLVVSVSFVAGAFGRNIVEAAGEKLLRKVDEVRQETRAMVGPPAAIAYTHAAKDLTKHGEYEQALEVARMALRNDPNQPGAYIEEGRALKRLGRVDEALSSVEKALKLSPEKPEALYNRACYNALLRRSIGTVVMDLKKAIALIPGLKNEALKDPDLDNVRNLPEIREILEGATG